MAEISFDLFNRIKKYFSEKESNESKREEERDLLDCLKRAKYELDNANRNFEFADSKDLIDIFTYQIKVAQTRYDYLLKKAKRKNLDNTKYLGVG
jgi:hypothetical protein